MFKLTVFKYLSDKHAEATASHRQVLIDHLKASAERNGFGLDFHAGDNDGELYRDGYPVAGWHIVQL